MNKVIQSDDDLIKEANLILDAYVGVSQQLANRGIFLGLGIDNGFSGKPCAITSLQAVKVVVKPPAPEELKQAEGARQQHTH